MWSDHRSAIAHSIKRHALLYYVRTVALISISGTNRSSIRFSTSKTTPRNQATCPRLHLLNYGRRNTMATAPAPMDAGERARRILRTKVVEVWAGLQQCYAACDARSDGKVIYWENWTARTVSRSTLERQEQQTLTAQRF